MPHVAALYRYPVKGFTAESCETLTVLDEGRIAGDRVFGVRFATTEAADDEWSKKTGMVALVNTPGLALLRLRFEEKELRLQINLGDAVLADQVLNPEGRAVIAAAVEEYLRSLDENPFSGHPERLPLRLVGDGITPRYHDSETGRVTLHGRGSLRALTATLEKADLSEVRFRSNIAVEGLEAWEEQRWIGGRIRVGTVEFDVVKPKVRCLAT
ncbi:MAG: MOSC N-terminal beta barrel domain-containing protein, partial [Pseudomonadota bacterium]